MNLLNIILLVLGTVSMIVYLILMNKADKEYSDMFETLDASEHTFMMFYPLGYWILEKINFNFSNKYARKIQSNISIVQGKKYAEYFTRVNISGKVGTSLLAIPLTLLIFGASGVPITLIFAPMWIFIFFYYFDMVVSDEMKKRADEIESDLPNIISKLALLVNAGMILKYAWKKVAYTGDTTLYLEMQNAVDLIENGGYSEEDAYKFFADQCQSSKVKRFIGTLIQNVSKGNKDLVFYLKEQSRIAWQEKKEYVKQKANAASSKLMIPVGLILIGIIILVVMPMLSNFGIA